MNVKPSPFLSTIYMAIYLKPSPTESFLSLYSKSHGSPQAFAPHTTISHQSVTRPGPVNLTARLQADNVKQCWDSLMELKSCTGEVILFFLNGETYLGPGCCRAIRVIEHRCSAADAMLAVLGFTAEEGDMLRGYCDDALDSSPPPPAPLVQLDRPPPPLVSEDLVRIR